MAELLSLTGKRWIEPLTLVLDGRQSLSQRIAMERGLLAPPAQGTYPAMQQATERVHRAIASGECVGLFGDYDCDGITSAAQLVRFFRRQNIEPVVRLPHRVHDGYGLQQESVEWFATQKVTLLITVDTGIASVTEVEQANSLGIDVIVTDHHRPAENIPNAFAILHPSLSPNFPKPHPSGAGVVYDFLFALEHGQWEGKESDCALAMIGTVADLVPLLGRNRVLVQRGLECLQQLSNCPLADMRDRTKTASSTDVAFRIAPRINAAGRIDDPLIGLRALLEGGEALSQLDALNEHRQTLMRQCVDDAIRGIADPDSAFLLWTASSEYPHGIIGLIAGRLTEKYGKPSCAVTIDGNTCTASLRSPICYHITEGLSRCNEYLSSFGGHAQAAGCSFPTKNLAAVRHALQEDIASHTSPEALQPSLVIDAELRPSDIQLSLIEDLSMLEPYGQGNPEPRFLLRNVPLDALRCVGAEKAHMQCVVQGCKAIGFNLGSLAPECSAPMDIVCRIGIDTWNGRKQPQVFIEDMRITVEEKVMV